MRQRLTPLRVDERRRFAKDLEVAGLELAPPLLILDGIVLLNRTELILDGENRLEVWDCWKLKFEY